VPGRAVGCRGQAGASRSVSVNRPGWRLGRLGRQSGSTDRWDAGSPLITPSSTSPTAAGGGRGLPLAEAGTGGVHLLEPVGSQCLADLRGQLGLPLPKHRPDP